MTGESATPVERVIVDPAERRPAVIQVIDGARERLHLSIFRCDEEPVLDALERAVRRGVHVRALVTGRAKGSKAQLKRLRATLKALGVDVRRYADAVVRYHAKYVVADNGPAVVASLNFTGKCFNATCDFMVVSSDADLVSTLLRVCEADWQGAALRPEDRRCDRLIVGPEQARARFVALIGQATQTIRLIDPKITDPAMLLLLRTREAQGIRVDIRGRLGLGPLVAHGKLLMIDDEAAAIGSISLSTLALEFRREIAVVIRDRPSLDTLNRFWQSLPPTSTDGVSSAASVEVS
jgi:phosphatidylserine/phosphatidylglycerophosphate/cardiolipin synthase-like enzyme